MRVGILARVLRNNFDRQVASFNVTRSQWMMIGVVAHQPGATQRMIAEALEMSEASAGRLVDRLCAEGLLERRAREDDRRAKAVYLTKQAEPLLERLAAVAQESEERMFRGFSEEEIDKLSEFLDRIQENLNRG